MHVGAPYGRGPMRILGHPLLQAGGLSHSVLSLPGTGNRGLRPFPGGRSQRGLARPRGKGSGFLGSLPHPCGGCERV